MAYLLHPEVALRGWQLVPMAYRKRGGSLAKGLKQEEFDLLRKCDGETEILPSPILDMLLSQGVCVPAEHGEKPAEWQAYRYCDNRYFPAVIWAITSKCNFNCRHCFNAADNAPLISEFSLEQCLDFIDQLDECGVLNVNLTGGEPMLHPHFMDVCREIERRGMTVTEITTNGSFITAEILDEFADFCNKPLFKLSFDGLGHHDWFRMKEGAERDVIEKTRLLLDKGFKVRWQTNVHRGNRDTILPMIKLAESMGVEMVRVIRTSEAPRWAQMGGDLCLSMEEYYEFALGLTEAYIKENLKINILVWQAFQYWGNVKLYSGRPMEAGEHIYNDKLSVCRANRRQISVTGSGDIVPCNQMGGYFMKHGMHMGNVHETPLKELLTDSEYLDAVCCTVGELREENPECKACPHWKQCMGGCRAAALLFNDSYYKYDPTKCIFFYHYRERFESLFNEEWRCVDDV